MGEEVMEIIENRKKLREKVIREAKRWAQSLKIPCTVILIGSYARGDFNLWSDIDIIVISKEFKGRPIERLDMIDISPGYEVIPITPSELTTMFRKREPMVLEMKKFGIILRDDLNIEKMIRQHC